MLFLFCFLTRLIFHFMPKMEKQKSFLNFLVSTDKQINKILNSFFLFFEFAWLN